MKYIFSIVIIAFLFTSCSEKTSIVSKNTSSVKETVDYKSFGDKITPDGAITTNDLMNKFSSEDSIFVKVVSQVETVCKKKGCWMTLPLSTDVNMRVKFKDYAFFMPLNCEEKNVIVEGWAYKGMITVAMLRHYAMDGGATEDEANKITEPKVEYSFMANGVLMY